MTDKKLRSRARKLEVLLKIGKSGITDTVIEEVKRQLKAKKLIKVKFLKSALEDKDKKQMFKKLAEETGSELVYSVGFTVSLYRK